MDVQAYNGEILSTLKDLRDKVSKIEGILLAMAAQRGASDASSAGAAAPRRAATREQRTGGGEVASDRDLDSQYGNPVVKKDPKNWKGPSYMGCQFSECPPEYLEVLAELKDWQAGKDDEKGTADGKKYAGYARKDAARARGWAERIRNGWGGQKAAPQASAAPADDYFGGGYDDVPQTDDDIPF